MSCQVVYTPRAVADLKSLDRPARALVYGWITKNLEGCADPRWQGDGDPEGGRWRYCIGEYRLIAEIEGERIVILAVNTGLGLRLSWKNMHAGPNVFLKSTLRQPVKTALLLAVMALITFAFVSRGAEYLLVKQETERLGEYYKSVGVLQSTTGDRWADTTEVVTYLEGNSMVEMVNTYNHTSAIMEEDFCNADIDCDGPGKPNCYFYFYGTLLDWNRETFNFYVDTVLSGYPEVVKEGGRVTLFRDFRHSDYPFDIDEANRQLKLGECYLVQGYYRPKIYPSCKVEISTPEPGIEIQTTYAVAGQVVENGHFYPVPADMKVNWSDPRLIVSEEDIQISFDEQRALNIIPIKDMNALPETRDTVSGIYLTDGRWLNDQDDKLGSKVCVINANLASLRGLKLGDTLTNVIKFGIGRE